MAFKALAPSCPVFLSNLIFYSSLPSPSLAPCFSQTKSTLLVVAAAQNILLPSYAHKCNFYPFLQDQLFYLHFQKALPDFSTWTSSLPFLNSSLVTAVLSHWHNCHLHACLLPYKVVRSLLILFDLLFGTWWLRKYLLGK